MSNFNFYTANEVYAEKYFQLPKVFFTNEKYKKMSNDSKVAYAILKDRFSYSVKNKWVDKQNRIYFVFTVEELKNMLNCAEGKVAKVKKELTEMNLLFQERGGSTWINADNLYYTPSLDTNRHIIDTREAEQEAVLLENFVTLMQDDSIATFVPENALSLIKTFSSTLKDAKKTVKLFIMPNTKPNKCYKQKLSLKNCHYTGEHERIV